MENRNQADMPVQPAQPAQQGQPAQPVQPIQQGQPVQSVQPVQPAQPVQQAPGMQQAAKPAQAARPGHHLPNRNAAQQTQNAPIAVNACVISHRGCVRDNNEDNFFFNGDILSEEEADEGAVICQQFNRPFHLFAVCDGMGGLQGGERASAICVQSMGVLNMGLPISSITRAIDAYADEACRRVYQDSLEIGEDGREGSTMAVLYMTAGKGYVGNVGDSRVYLLRMGKLYQLSTDHSTLYQMMLKGQLTREQMRKHPKANVIGAFIGMEEGRKPKPYAAHYEVNLCAGDRFLICSDGLSDLLSHDEIQRRLAETKDIRIAAEQLIWRAMEMGGKDNTTVMILDLAASGLPVPTAASLARLPLER